MSRHTLATLASELGVSRQTISNVLNAPERVKPATRERVQAAIDASGYRPSAAARQLRTRRSMNFGMRLMPTTNGINSSILDRFLHSATVAGQEAGYRLTLFTADSDEQEIQRYEELLDTAGLDGFILASTSTADPRTRWLLDQGTPFAVFGRPWDGSHEDAERQYPWVDVDGAAGTEHAAGMLLEQGHTCIGFLGWGEDSPVGEDRRAGWLRAMEKAGLAEAADGLAVRTEDTVPAGAAGAASLLSRGATAIVCASDSLALGAMGTLRELQPWLFRPGAPAGPGQRAAIVGFDDTPVAAALGLSSVAQPVEEAARHVIRLLHHALGGIGSGGPAGADGLPPDRSLLLAPRVIERVPLPLAAAVAREVAAAVGAPQLAGRTEL